MIAEHHKDGHIYYDLIKIDSKHYYTPIDWPKARPMIKMAAFFEWQNDQTYMGDYTYLIAGDLFNLKFLGMAYIDEMVKSNDR